MPTLYIEEYQELARDDKGSVMGPDKLITTQKITVGAASAASSAFSAKTKFLIVESDIACQFEVAETPVADTNSQYLSPNNRKLVPVPLSSNTTPFKIAVIEQQ